MVFDARAKSGREPDFQTQVFLQMLATVTNKAKEQLGSVSKEDMELWLSILRKPFLDQLEIQSLIWNLLNQITL